MTTLTISNLEEINAAIQSHNPFAKPPYFNSNSVWGNGFPDVETFNAHASDAVFQALKQIRSGQYETTSILITAQDGTGKTHIISRIRHHLQIQGNALFVYANKYGDINQIQCGFQRILADSLKHIGSEEVWQWQELATYMASKALKSVNPDVHTFSSQELVKKFQYLSPEKLKKLVHCLTREFCKIQNVSDPDIIKAIFWTLSNEQALYAFKWLAGEELAQYKANELRLPNQNQSFDSILQILDLISQYKELVICFDEIDPPEIHDNGLTIAQIVAGFVKKLFENFSRGVILSVMMPGTWQNRVKQLPPGVFTKLSAQGNPINLNYMDGDSIVELVTLWLTQFYKSRNLIPPELLYPFTEDKLRDIERKKFTAREVLKWCRDNCQSQVIENGDKNYIEIKPDPVEIAFNNEEENLSNYLDDHFQIADALLFGFQGLIDQTVERVTLEEVTTEVKNIGGKDHYINFKIIGEEDGKKVRIGVAVLQYNGGRALGAGLRRLNDYEKFNLTRGCLVRSKSSDRRISRHLHKKYIEPLILEKGGEFVELKEEEIKPLIAIRAVHHKREVDYGLSEEQIFKFIAEKGAEKKLGVSNPLLQEILSDPSYEVPDDVVEEESATSSGDSGFELPDSDDTSELSELMPDEQINSN